MRRKIAAGNWKMNGTGADIAMLTHLAQRHSDPSVDILICPPATLIERAARAVEGSSIRIGGQDCHAAESGAHTGDIAAPMLRDAGAGAVIVGHSERRHDHRETDGIVRAKAEAALTSGLATIICVGETLAEREAGTTLDVIGGQMASSLPDTLDGSATMLAYEPIWAIGTGRVPDAAQIAEVHAFMRNRLRERFGQETAEAMRLLYGGSVKGANAAEIFAIPNVDGALVGGASLAADDFSPIIAALEAAR
ncbi:triose-phosphate isomerase [Sedimentitalea arenosa]|uniref:Triosephosphate isomerase n=1 Tax=Sedimentitalea arenosa TaxID=2798803 RepID=A0A8J7IV77_9RHOB|nr:triose-phosphate isomerase [Arenibacterium arenosum]MBJ6373531.1 triose-phosphate isomerase [Arenibacterium arenosum]